MGVSPPKGAGPSLPTVFPKKRPPMFPGSPGALAAQSPQQKRPPGALRRAVLAHALSQNKTNAEAGARQRQPERDDPNHGCLSARSEPSSPPPEGQALKGTAATTRIYAPRVVFF